MAVRENGDRPRKKKKEQPKEAQDDFLKFQLIRLPSDDFLFYLTDILIFEKVSFQIQTHLIENGVPFYTILFRVNDIQHQNWIIYLVKTKVYQGANFICD